MLSQEKSGICCTGLKNKWALMLLCVLCARVWVWTCHGVSVGVGGQLSGVNSLPVI